MSFFTKAKNKAVEVKIRGEIAVIDRELMAFKRSFGIELYDLFETLEVQQKTNAVSGAPLFLGTESKQIKQVFTAAQTDIRKLTNDRDSKEAEIKVSQANRERAPPAFSNREKLERAGSWVSSSSLETKLKAEMALLERKKRHRKEQFGIEVFEFLEKSDTANTENGEKKGMLRGVKAGITNTVSKLSPNESKVKQCVERGKAQHESILWRRARKEREIARLHEED